MFTFGQFYGHVGFIICISEKQVARRFERQHKNDPFYVDMGHAHPCPRILKNKLPRDIKLIQKY